VSHRLSAVSSDYCSVCQNGLLPSAAATASSPRWPLAAPFLMTNCQPAPTKARLKCQHRMTKGPRGSSETNCVRYELILHCSVGLGCCWFREARGRDLQWAGVKIQIHLVPPPQPARAGTAPLAPAYLYRLRVLQRSRAAWGFFMSTAPYCTAKWRCRVCLSSQGALPAEAPETGWGCRRGSGGSQLCWCVWIFTDGHCKGSKEGDFVAEPVAPRPWSSVSWGWGCREGRKPSKLGNGL